MRQELRERYERDQKRRQGTRRMSELLLKGATMTDSHCDTHGDPIFRYEGQEFCPTCAADDGQEAVVDVDGAESEGEGEGESGEATETAGAAGTSAGDSGASGDEAETGDEPATAAAPPEVDLSGGETESEPTVASPPEGAEEGGEVAAEPRQPAPAETPGRSRAPSRATGASGPDGDLASARSSLITALSRFAERAAATDDPRLARDHLEAAREAAEALAALDRR